MACRLTGWMFWWASGAPVGIVLADERAKPIGGTKISRVGRDAVGAVAVVRGLLSVTRNDLAQPLLVRSYVRVKNGPRPVWTGSQAGHPMRVPGWMTEEGAKERRRWSWFTTHR